MSLAGSFRRLSGRSGIVVGILALVALSGTGCHSPALRALKSESPPVAEPPESTSEPESDPAPSLTVTDEATAPPSAMAAREPTATPMLDAAIARAEERETHVRLEPPSPFPLHPARAASLPAMPATTEANREPETDGESPTPEPPLTPIPKRDDAIRPASDTSTTGEGSTRETPREPDLPATQAKTPAESWNEHIGILRSLTDRVGEGVPEDPELWEVRSTLLAWLAAHPTSNLTDPELREVVEAIESSTPLTIAELRLCRRVLGFGLYEGVEPTSLRPGQALILYCEMAGLRYEPGSEGFRSRLTSLVELQSRADGRTVWSEELGTAEDTCARRRRDYYVNYRVKIPENLAPGDYDLVLHQTDLIADRGVTERLGVTIAPLNSASESKGPAESR